MRIAASLSDRQVLFCLLQIEAGFVALLEWVGLLTQWYQRTTAGFGAAKLDTEEAIKFLKPL